MLQDINKKIVEEINNTVGNMYYNFLQENMMIASRVNKHSPITNYYYDYMEKSKNENFDMRDYLKSIEFNCFPTFHETMINTVKNIEVAHNIEKSNILKIYQTISVKRIV